MNEMYEIVNGHITEQVTPEAARPPRPALGQNATKLMEPPPMTNAPRGCGLRRPITSAPLPLPARRRPLRGPNWTIA